MEDLERLKKDLAVTEAEIHSIEKTFDKKTKRSKRRYSYEYTKAVAKYSFIYGKISVLEESTHDSAPDYIG